MQPTIIRYLADTQGIDPTKVQRAEGGVFDYKGDIAGVCKAVIDAMGT